MFVIHVHYIYSYLIITISFITCNSGRSWSFLNIFSVSLNDQIIASSPRHSASPADCSTTRKPLQ